MQIFSILILFHLLASSVITAEPAQRDGKRKKFCYLKETALCIIGIFSPAMYIKFLCMDGTQFVMKFSSHLFLCRNIFYSHIAWPIKLMDFTQTHQIEGLANFFISSS